MFKGRISKEEIKQRKLESIAIREECEYGYRCWMFWDRNASSPAPVKHLIKEGVKV